MSVEQTSTMTKDEFETYVREEVQPVAATFDLVVSVTAVVKPLDEDQWPAWKYHPKTGVGAIYARPEDVPEGFLDAPPKN